MTRIPLIVTLLTLLLSACQGKQGAPLSEGNDPHADSAAVQYYLLRVQGRFNEYVQAMHSCQESTPEYRKRIVDMLRQHQVQIDKDKKGVRQVKALRTEKNSQGDVADVYLSVTYNDGSHEEIIFPLVRKGGTWKIQ